MNPEKARENPEGLYKVVDSLIHNPSETTYVSFFTVVKELRRIDPGDYIQKLILQIEEAKKKGILTEERKTEFWKIIRGA